MPISKLQAALAWARRGFRVFPLEANGKNPTISAFQQAASSDPSIIEAWWRDPLLHTEHDYNIGVLTTGMVVVDVDVKKGKPGLQNYFGLGGHFETLTVETPTGGYHCYFEYPDSGNAVDVVEGVDIRSHNGYVLAPGSTIDGKIYKVAVDQPRASLPETISARLHRPGERNNNAITEDLDDPRSITLATDWLAHNAPLAIEGMGGDSTTYNVACKLVRDFALSEEMAFELLVRGWNDRCSPPWSPDELLAKVQNAVNYAIGPQGGALPEIQFSGVTVLPAPTDIPPFQPPALAFGNATLPEHIPVRPWLVQRLLMRSAVTVLAAAGATGKTTLALTIAAHGAAAKDFAGYKFATPFKTVMYSAEEDRDELSRRLLAVCSEYAIDFEKARAGIMLVGSDDIPLTVATVTGRQPSSNKDHVEWLMSLVRQPDVGLLILDPLVELHTCDENDTVQMRFVMSILRMVAREGTVAVLAPHHTSKGGAMSQGRAGNADISRGAGSIINSARVALTLVAATEQDREVYGIPESDKHLYVRLDDAKMNLALATSNSIWFKKTGVCLYNGDEVGVIKHFVMSANDDTQKRAVAEICADSMMNAGRAVMSIQEAVSAVQEHDTLYAKMTPTILRTKLERLLMRGVKTDFGTVAWMRDENGMKPEIRLV